MADVEDPLVSAYFGVDFQGEVMGYFQECTGLGSENEVVEQKAVSDKGVEILIKVPGRMKFNNITLKRGITSKMDMWTWRKQVENGQVSAARRDGSIVMYGQDGSEMARWNLKRAWPSKLTGPAPNATQSQIGIEELEIVHEGYERVT
jgi:phage tail-like protein